MATFVLVHGAFMDFRCWEPVRSALEMRGHCVLTPGLPAHGDDPANPASVTLDDYVDAVTDAVDRAREPVVLVGHSMGGTVITAAAEQRPHSIDRLVYVSAFVPADGESQFDLASTDAESLVVSNGVVSEDGSVFIPPPGDYEEVFFGGLDRDEADEVRGTLRPEPVAPLVTPVRTTACGWGVLQKTYVVTTTDRAVGSTLQRTMYERAGIGDVVTMDDGHLTPLLHPGPLVTALERGARGIGADYVDDAVGEARWRWRSPQLGPRVALDVPGGRIDAFVAGTGPTIVFVHGWFANANLWRTVVERLAGRYRCVSLDLPLGAHRRAMDPDASLDPSGCGHIITAALDALDLHDVTLVGSDSGGAYSQVALANDDRRVGRLVLTSCETPYDEFPPEPFSALPELACDPAGLRRVLAALRSHAARRNPIAFGSLMRHEPDVDAEDSYALPALYDDGVLHDVAQVMRAASTTKLHETTAIVIESFAKPVLFVWPSADPVFPIEHARNYAALLHDARIVEIADSYGFVAEDQPDLLAAAIADFAT